MADTEVLLVGDAPTVWLAVLEGVRLGEADGSAYDTRSVYAPACASAPPVTVT